MEKRVLGRTGLEVSALSLGGIFLSSKGGIDRDEARRAVHRALELGVNYIDTAPRYANSEEVLGYALRDVSTPYYLSTKLGGRPQPFDPKDKDVLHRSVEESLRLLGRDTIDILYIHEPDRPGQFDWWDDYEHCHGPVSEVLDELKARGVIRFTGLGATTAYELPHLIATGQYDVVLTALNYSLLWREAAIAVIPEARRHNVGIVADRRCSMACWRAASIARWHTAPAGSARPDVSDSAVSMPCWTRLACPCQSWVSASSCPTKMLPRCWSGPARRPRWRPM
jgi:aryl-alcohol dehydrogenase-like predicted oxidoreductase